MKNIPKNIQFVLEKLNNSCFEAYIVGGCVRDFLMGEKPHDYDITTSATPNDVINLFEKTIPTGIKHGTVTVIIDHEPIEVTTFRTDGKYSDQRRPDSVTFVTDLKEDLSRRDFTVNAIAYNNQKGFVDYFSGIDDIKNKTLKAVGNPEKRFTEDALRIMRLYRFSSVLGFSIELKTFEASIKCSYLLKNISRERIMIELLKMICGKNPSAIKPLLEYKMLSFLKIENTFDFNLLKKVNDNELLTLFTFLYLSKSDVSSVLSELKASNLQKSYCKSMLYLLCTNTPNTKEELKEILNITGTESYNQYLIFNEKILNVDTTALKEYLNEIIYFNEPYRIKDLKIDGNILKNNGIEPNKIGITLEKLRKMVIKNPSLNTKTQLTKLIRN